MNMAQYGFNCNTDTADYLLRTNLISLLYFDSAPWEYLSLFVSAVVIKYIPMS